MITTQHPVYMEEPMTSTEDSFTCVTISISRSSKSSSMINMRHTVRSEIIPDCLFGNGWQSIVRPNANLPTNNVARGPTPGSPPDSFAKCEEPGTPNTVIDELDLCLHETHIVEQTQHDRQQHLSRCDSTERRLNEVAQFFHSIGESPTVEDSIRGIPDEGDDGDEIDENIEVPVDKDGAPLVRDRPLTRSERHMKWLQRALSRKRNTIASWPSLPVEPHKHSDFQYKGIVSNPPEITQSGMARGNYSLLHRKAWLEVADKHHRYGKHLRLYYRHWESLGYPFNDFFQWLDSTGEAAGQPRPELDSCPRSELDSDTVLYITDADVTKGYMLTVRPETETGRGRIYDVDNQTVATGPDGWIFVMRDHVLYGAPKVTCVKGNSKQRFHHSSFFGGKAVAAAGILVTDSQGYLLRVYPHSGHYRPGEAEMQRVLFFLENEGVRLDSIEVDMQQLIHVSRDNDTSDAIQDCPKKRKLNSLFLLPGTAVADLLSHKARCIDDGLFTHIQQLAGVERRTPNFVRIALEVIDKGGFWKRGLEDW